VLSTEESPGFDMCNQEWSKGRKLRWHFSYRSLDGPRVGRNVHAAICDGSTWNLRRTRRSATIGTATDDHSILWAGLVVTQCVSMTSQKRESALGGELTPVWFRVICWARTRDTISGRSAEPSKKW